MTKGLTIIEMMVVVVVFLVILLSILSVLTTSRKSWQIGSIQLDVQQQVRQAMETITKELRSASGIDETTFVDGLSDDIIRFTTQAGTVIYTLNGTQLLRNFSGANTVVANDIVDAQFNLVGGDIIFITLTSQKTSTAGYVAQISLNSQVTLRN